MKEFFTKRKFNIFCSVAAILLMWVVWLIVYNCVKNDYIVPSFSDTMKSLWKCLSEGTFWTAFGFTTLRTGESFLISFVLAGIFAALSSLSKTFRALASPVMSFLRTVPTLAIILLLLIWTNPKVAPVIVTVLVLFPMLYARFIAAWDGVDGGIKEMAEVYSINSKDRLFKIYLPLISPNILSQLGADVSLGLKVVISAEVLSNTFRSLGGLMQNARAFVEIPRLAALTLVSVVLGLIADIAFSQFARITYRWSRRENER